MTPSANAAQVISSLLPCPAHSCPALPPMPAAVFLLMQLLVVGAAKDLRQHPAVCHLVPAAYDLTVGGLAGTVAVLVSMPFDVIKTYIQTHGGIQMGPAGVAAAAGAACSSSSSSVVAAAGSGIAGSAGLFWSTGKALVAKGGPQALFVGLAPRLAHQVPGESPAVEEGQTGRQGETERVAAAAQSACNSRERKPALGWWWVGSLS